MKKKCIGLLASLIVFNMGAVQAEEVQDVSEFTLDPIYITATRYDKKDLDIPASTQVFTREDLDAMNAKSVMEVLGNIPGFTISESPSGNGSPGIRGITGHLAILINGIPLSTESYYQMGTLSMGGIERIEVVKGGSAVLYGSRASTGVINIITKKNGENNIAVGLGNHKQASISTNLSLKKLSLSYDWYRTKNAGLVYDSSTMYYRDYLVRKAYMLQYDPDEHWNFMMLYNQKDNTCSRVVKKTGASQPPWNNKTRYGMFQSTYKNKDLRVTAYYQKREWNSMLGASHNIDRGRHYGIDMVNKWDLGKTLLTAGGMFERIEARQFSSNKWNDRERNHGSIYFMTETPVSDKTKVLFGAREVFTGDSGNAFCPQLQVLHKLTDNQSFYINVNKSLLEPALAQRYGYMSSTTTPNPDLKAEKGWTYEMGWKQNINKNGLLKFDVFHMDIDDRISTRKLADGTSQYYNVASYKNTGVELSYEWSVPKGFSYAFGVSFGNPKAKTNATSPWARTDEKYGAHADVRYNVGKMSVNVFANWANNRYNDVGSMLSVDMNMRYRMTDKDAVSLKVGNILDRSDFRGTGSSVLPERNWLLTYERKF